VKCLGTSPCRGKGGWTPTRGSPCGPGPGPGCGASSGSWEGTASGCQAPQGARSTLSSEPASGVNWGWPPASCRGDGLGLNVYFHCGVSLTCKAQRRGLSSQGGDGGCSGAGKRQCRHPCLESMIRGTAWSGLVH